MRCVVIGATGRFFCTGADLRKSTRRPPRSEEFPEKLLGDGRRMMLRGAIKLVSAIMDCEKPVIAAVQGTAAGIGAHVAFACDLVVAAEEAKFIEIFARRGLVADGLGTYLLPRLIGLQRAKELIFFADDVPAQRAYELGLVSRVVPGDRAGRGRDRVGDAAGDRADRCAPRQQVAAEPFVRRRPRDARAGRGVARRHHDEHRRQPGGRRQLPRAPAAPVWRGY